MRYREKLEHDVMLLGRGERLAQLGVVIAGLSALPFSSDSPGLGLVTLATGGVVAGTGVLLHRKRTQYGRSG